MNLRICAVVFYSIHTMASLNAAILTVTSLADSGAGSLRAQVAASAAGDTIQFSVSGTIILNSAISIGHTLFVQGPGPSALVVDANHVDRAFIIGINSTNVLSGMTITNGYVVGAKGLDGGLGQDGTAGDSAYGGAILDQGNSIILSNCWLVANLTYGGQGGRGGDNLFGGIMTPGSGGDGGNGIGGAVYSSSKYVAVVNCTFSANRAVGGDGGDGGTNYNPATGVIGGAGGQAGVGQGGAIDVSAVPIAGFTDSTFSGNRVGGGLGGKGGDNVNGPGGHGGDGGAGGGGAISTFKVSSFLSCTIVSNSAFGGIGGSGGNGTPVGAGGTSGSGTAGGVVGYVVTCNNPIANTILADNLASSVDSNYFMAFRDDGYNFIGSDDFALCPWSATTQVGTILLPLHPQLRPLAQNGGGLPTHATTLTSPATDAGFSFGLTTDERNAPRPYDFSSIPNAAGGDGSDIGAFELGRPDLGLGKGSNNILITWPASYGDFKLQSTTNVVLPNSWSSVTDSPAIVGSVLTVSNNPTGANRFYRLISP